MDKKGDLPTTMLIPVTLILVVLALFSFLTFNRAVDTASGEISEVMQEVAFSEQYVQTIAQSTFDEVVASGAESMKAAYQQRIAAQDLELAGLGNFFGKIRTGDFTIEKQNDGTVVLNTHGLFVQSVRGLHKLRREFDLELHGRSVPAPSGEKI